MAEAQSILDSLGIWVGSAVVTTLLQLLLPIAIHNGWLEKLGINRPCLKPAPPEIPMSLTMSPDEVARSEEVLLLLRPMDVNLKRLAEDGHSIQELASAHSQESGDVLVLQRVPRASIPSAAHIPQV
jgi:hypothetical protein